MFAKVLFIASLVACATTAYWGGNNYWDFGNLGQNIAQNVQQYTRPLDGLGARINSQVQNSLKGLSGLGAQINQQVQADLKPVRILAEKQTIRSGSNGVTVATYKPSGKQLVFKNGVAYECDGDISKQTGECSGSLRKYEFKNDDDYCYRHPNAIVDNVLCFSRNGYSISVSSVNGNVKCSDSNGDKAHTITRSKYEDECRGKIKNIDYVYFTNGGLQNESDEIKCDKSENSKYRLVCRFSETWTIPNNGGGSLVLNSGSFVINY